jgi:hypothetical protein
MIDEWGKDLRKNYYDPIKVLALHLHCGTLE